MTIGILASGNLGLSVLRSCEKYLRPAFIATDSGSIAIAAYVETNSIPVFKGSPKNGKLAAFMRNNPVDLLLSVNYLFLIEQDVIDLVKHAVNFHGSLLPKYRGRAPHIWAIINNELKTGVSAHIIDQGCDTGAIILQEEVQIDDFDTGADILEKFEKIYPEMVAVIVDKIKANSVILFPQDNSIATYFGKRIPEDGVIDWNWQKERIRNWVRAQAYPYPGSFTTLNDEKIIIDHISYCDFGFSGDDANGLVLAHYPDVIVKTPNGAVILDKIRTNRQLIQTGLILGK